MTTAPKVRVLRGVTVKAADLDTVRASGARALVVDPELVRAATEDGYDAGYQAGFDAGLADSARAIDTRERQRSAAVADVIERLNAASERIAQEHTGVLTEIESRIIDLACALAETIVGHELSASTNPGRDALVRALQFAPETGHVHVRMHPGDAELLGDVASTLGRRSLTVTSDSTLTTGDCIVDIDSTRIDARIAPALARIKDVLAR